MRIFILLLFLSSYLNGISQTFEIGHLSTSFTDGVRGRNITVEIYYPADNTGQNQPVSSGSFPVLVFAHGFLMTWQAYENFWTDLVPNGYIICFPTTETGFTPNHSDFGDDIRFIADQMQVENQNSASFFYNSVAPSTALMGHSMGGGACLLAAQNNANIQTVVNFAAAETSPSAISASAFINVPTLLFSGDDDCIAPPNAHQDLMYDATASSCKTQISIVDGGHCYFANNNINCNIGEGSCNPNLGINRTTQQAVTQNFLSLWLNAILKSDASSVAAFNDSLIASTRSISRQDCSFLGSSEPIDQEDIIIYPNPADSKLNISVPRGLKESELIIYNGLGQEIKTTTLTNGLNELNVSSLHEGIYQVIILEKSIKVMSRSIVISHSK